jgi:hypothetical protein
MEAVVPRQLGVKRCRQHVSLSGGDDASIRQARKYLDVCTDVGNHGRSYEDGMKRRIAKSWYRQVCFEAVDLAAKGVSLHTDVHGSQILPVEPGRATGKNDGAGARSPDWLPGLGHRSQWIEEIIGIEQARDRGAFASWDYQRVDTGEVRRSAHLTGGYPDAFEDGCVFGEVALQREDSNCRHWQLRDRSPAAGGEQFGRRERLRSDSAHCCADTAGHLGDNVWILVVRDRFDDRLGALLRFVRLEDA